MPIGVSCSKDILLDKVRIMPKVTSKLQLTVPKKIADQYGIRPGDELEWIPAGDSIRVEPARCKTKAGELTAKGAPRAVRCQHKEAGRAAGQSTDGE